MESTDALNLHIVIINYKTAGLTIDCLTSLAGQASCLPGTWVTVVDNASGDGPSDQIRRAITKNGWQGWARLIESERNLGFAGGNNHALRAFPGARYVLLLNSDTIVHAGCLTHCMSVMEGDESIGAMSCLILNADGSVQNVTRKFTTPLRQTVCAFGLSWKWPGLFGWADCEDKGWDRRRVTRDVDWLGGAFLFIRGTALDSVGLLDEAFFFYGEDIEFCHRLAAAGYRRHYDPTVSTTHLGGASSVPGILDLAARDVHRWCSRYMVQRKCYGALAAHWLRFVDLGTLTLRQLKRLCTGKAGTPAFKQTVDVLRLLMRPLPWEVKS